jgi:hypothetical protein
VKRGTPAGGRINAFIMFAAIMKRLTAISTAAFRGVQETSTGRLLARACF